MIFNIFIIVLRFLIKFKLIGLGVQKIDQREIYQFKDGCFDRSYVFINELRGSK